ncbi:MAG: TIGR03032 family protein [Gemmataceae bacterium]|nr:TIGR03032 family protein [Gemmataceae bacterium]
MSASIPHPLPEGLTIQCRVDEGFADWISRLPGSVAISTYQAGKVVLVGWDGRQVSVLPRNFDKPMGMAVHGPHLAVATRHEVVILADAPLLAPDFLPGQPGRYDALYAPRVSYFTGDLNIHDLAFTADGLWLVNTRFCCLAVPSTRFSFEPRWQPPFISQLAPEDRCHLNGLAVVDGKPKYATALGETDSVGGWRPGKATGGVVVDVESNAVVVRGLAMPHSPRWAHRQLWVLNSGAGELWAVDPATGRHVVIASLPGYLRGLCVIGRHALVGLCQIREKHIFGGLPVQERFPRLLCGVGVVDLQDGRTVGMLEFTAGCQELFDIQLLPNVRRPMILGPGQEAARQAFPAPAFGYWLRPENMIHASDKPPGARG